MRQIHEARVKKSIHKSGNAGTISVRFELAVPNPKLRLLDQVKEVMRLRQSWIRTEPRSDRGKQPATVTGLDDTSSFMECARGLDCYPLRVKWRVF